MGGLRNLADYAKENKFDFGLPQGDTIIDLQQAQVEETKFKTNEGVEKQAWRITLPTGQSYNVPKSVMAKIKEMVEAGKTKVRITRTGERLSTSYTVVSV